MANFDILKTLGINNTQNTQEHKAPKYNRALYGALPTSKAAYNAAVDCDVYISGSAMHFQTGKKHGQYNTGYASLQEAFAVIQQMAKLGVPGIWDIAQNLETKRFEIIPAPRYKK